MSDTRNIPGIGIVTVNATVSLLDPNNQPLPVEQWERDRAQLAAELTRRVMGYGVGPRDPLDQIVSPDMLTADQDPILRRVIYGLLGALSIIEPWFSAVTFFNGWGPIQRRPLGTGSLVGAEPAGSIDMITFGVCKDPFGFNHWRGGVMKTGTLSTGRELIMTLPGRYGPGSDGGPGSNTLGGNMVQYVCPFHGDAGGATGSLLIEISRTADNVTRVFTSDAAGFSSSGAINPKIDLSSIVPYDSRP